ncbi:uncharacterized protein LOC115223720 [Octopus sinensis]|uniref:Uncharacterized protein LOC115223720 n=1 Tax=Octopus sinensis TaxID=2607531 RepID=A0A6P7TMN8_9MOLL|nr:uncharacterized protein LOC115223720 [Octopus sinensis]
MDLKKYNISYLALLWLYICCYYSCCCYADSVNVTVQPEQADNISVTLSPTKAKQMAAVVGQKKEKVSHDIYIQDGKSGESAAAVAHIEGTESPNQTNELTSSKSYVTNQRENSASVLVLNMMFALCSICVTLAAVFPPKFL